MNQAFHSSAGVARLRRGTSLVELLVVLVIIALLAALLLPAIQAAREAARVKTCQNSLRQSAIAVLAYVNTHGGELPPLWRTDRMVPWENFPWRVAILAEFEEASLADRLELELLPLSDPNRPIAQIAIPVFECPSTPDAPRLIEKMGTAAVGYADLQVAACDYSAVFEVTLEDNSEPLSGAWCRRTVGLPSVGGAPPDSVTPDLLGPHRRMLPSHLRKIADGLSKTILLAEQAGKPVRYDAARAPHDVTPSEGPWATGEMAVFYAPGVNRDNFSGPYGFHSGADVAFCDGAVLMLSAKIEWAVLAALLTRDGDEIIDDADWR
jgi:prepilin-type N-terminal cleavage/methylation domain-containing protein